MKKSVSPTSTRKPPTPTDNHEVIREWMDGVMPGLRPIVEKLDQFVMETASITQFAVKWKKAFYGVPDKGWIIELVAYDVSVNIVFLSGGKFSDPPSMGEGNGRYVKIKSTEEAEDPSVRAWIEEAARIQGWRA